MSFKPLALSSPKPPSSSPLIRTSSASTASPATGYNTPSMGHGQGFATPVGTGPAGGGAPGKVGLGLLSGQSTPGGLLAAGAGDGKVEVTSPLDLTLYVNKLLDELEVQFDDMSNDVLSRLSSLSNRIDTLESSLGQVTQVKATP